MWARGPYKQAFETDNLTIAVVCPDERRCSILVDWTKRELKALEMDEYSQLFLFTAVSPVAVAPGRFFFGQVWAQIDSADAINLIDPPAQRERGEGVIYQQI